MIPTRENQTRWMLVGRTDPVPLVVVCYCDQIRASDGGAAS
jgi:hypothetical protein